MEPPLPSPVPEVRPLELGEKPVGVVRLGEEGGVAAVRAKTSALPSSAAHTPTQT